MTPDALRPGAMKEAARALGVGLVLLAAFTHARVPHAALPFWETNPAIWPVSVSPERSIPVLDTVTSSLDALGPTGSMLLSVVAMVGACLALCAEAASGRALDRSVMGLGLAGTAAALWHAAIGDVADAALGVAWVGGVWGAIAIWHVCRGWQWRRLVVGMLAGFVVVLAAKGAFQVFVDHPQTVADFRQDKEAALAARGWTVGSAPALLYERRLTQAEATGWFGLSNVLATFAAAGTVAAGGALPAWRRLGRAARAGVVGLGIASVSVLVMTGSKGGFGAAAVGAGAIGAWWLVARRRGDSTQKQDRWSGAVAVGLAAIPLASVVGRGIVGERIGELSLLFRWFYMQAAVRIFGSDPIVGVGPAGFQEAYLTAKNPLSPEEVTSPHSVVFDWVCTLGVLGLAWVVLVAAAAWRAGRAAGQVTKVEEPAEGWLTRPRMYVLLGAAVGSAVLCLVLAAGASMTISVGAVVSDADPLPMEALLAGLGVDVLVTAAWILIAAGAGPVLASRPWATGAMAVALVAHAQIEMTPVQAGSAPLWMAMLASGTPSGGGKRYRKSDRLLGTLPLAVTMVVLWVAVIPVAKWETELVRGARVMEPCGRLATGLRRAQGAALSPARRAELVRPIARELAALLDEDVASDQETLRRHMDRLVAERSAAAYGHIEAASAALGRVDGPTRALLVERAIATGQAVAMGAGGEVGEVDAGWAERAAAAAREFARLRPRWALAWMLVGDSLAARGPRGPEAGEAWRKAAELNPWGPAAWERLLQHARELGDDQGVAEAAKRLLEIDAMRRLDPLRQFPDERRRELERLRAGGGG